jgi:hypothetical protein
MTDSTCDICNDPLPPYSGRGRPRKRCEACASDKSALARAWREQNEERVRAYQHVAAGCAGVHSRFRTNSKGCELDRGNRRASARGRGSFPH